MGVPTSEVGYTIATTRRETTKVHKNMWWHWWGGKLSGPLGLCISLIVSNSYRSVHFYSLASCLLSVNSSSVFLLRSFSLFALECQMVYCLCAVFAWAQWAHWASYEF